MAVRGESITIQYIAWNTSDNAGKTGDAGNHTLQWIKDGTMATATNSPSEIDATNAPGLYKITITTSEATCDIGTLHGISSTTDVTILPVQLTFVRLPAVDPAANGGLPTVDGSNHVAGVQATVDANVTQILGTAPTETTSGNLAGNLSTLLDNGDAAATLTLDDVSTLSGTVDANVKQIRGASLTESTAGNLAANFSELFDNGDSLTSLELDDVSRLAEPVEANITRILGSTVTETTPGRLAGNLSTLLDNGDATATLTLDDIATGSLSGTVNANVTQVLGTSVTETTSGNLAGNLSTLLDNGDATATLTLDDVSTLSGTVDANLTQILGAGVTETTSGNLAGNLSTLLDNGDATATLTLDDVSTLATSDLDQALVDIGLDHMLSTSVSGSDVTDDSIIAKLVSANSPADWDDFTPSTDSAEALGDSVAAIAGNVELSLNTNAGDGDVITVYQGEDKTFTVSVDANTLSLGGSDTGTLVVYTPSGGLIATSTATPTDPGGASQAYSITLAANTTRGLTPTNATINPFVADPNTTYPYRWVIKADTGGETLVLARGWLDVQLLPAT